MPALDADDLENISRQISLHIAPLAVNIKNLEQRFDEYRDDSKERREEVSARLDEVEKTAKDVSAKTNKIMIISSTLATTLTTVLGVLWEFLKPAK